MSGITLAVIGLSIMLLVIAGWWCVAMLEAIRKRAWDDVAIGIMLTGAGLFLAGLVCDLLWVLP